MTHPRDPEAAEFVLGTLSAEERRAFAAAMAQDPALAGAVAAWEKRLDPLSSDLPPVSPSPSVWTAILDQLDGGTVLAFPPSPREAELRRSRAIWRAIAGGAGAIAAMLAVFIAGERVWSPSQPVLLAAINRSGDLPALIVRVDPRAGIVQVRAVAAETPAGRSLELWSIAAGQAPRSMGVVAGQTTRLRVDEASGRSLRDAVIAVTVEPPGGSPSGAPTGPVVYSGRLVEDSP